MKHFTNDIIFLFVTDEFSPFYQSSLNFLRVKNIAVYVLFWSDYKFDWKFLANEGVTCAANQQKPLRD